MNFKTFFITLVFLIVLGMFVSSKELTFPTNRDIRINIDLVNSSGLWNESGTEIVPYAGNLNLQIPSLTNCDTIDTDSNGIFSCGTDAYGEGGIGTTYNNENFTGNYYGVSTRFDNENFTEQFSIHNLTCIQLTGSADLCDGSDDGTEGSIYNQVNFTEDYYEITNRFYNSNWTELYELRISEQFNLNNLSSSGYDPSADDDWKLSNLTALNYDTSSADDFNLDNASGWDMSVADDWNLGNETYNTTEDIQNAINTSGFYNIQIDCDNILFDNGLGSAGICDGTDDGSGGSGTTYNNENFTGNYYGVSTRFDNENFTEQFSIHNLTCIQLTGSADLCDGSDDGTEGSIYNQANFTEDYYEITNRFYNLNWTELYEQRINEQFDLTNLSNSGYDPSSLDDWKQSNFTTTYDSRVGRYTKSNYSEEYSSTGYDLENMTSDYITHNISIKEYVVLVNSSMKEYVDISSSGDTSDIDDWNLGNETYNTTEDIQNAINTSGFYNIQVDCDNILFGTGIGSAGICDGTDDGSGGSEDTNASDVYVNKLTIGTVFDSQRMLRIESNLGTVLPIKIKSDSSDDVGIMYEADSENYFSLGIDNTDKDFKLTAIDSLSSDTVFHVDRGSYPYTFTFDVPFYGYWNGSEEYQIKSYGNCTGQVMVGTYQNGTPICEEDDNSGTSGGNNYTTQNFTSDLENYMPFGLNNLTDCNDNSVLTWSNGTKHKIDSNDPWNEFTLFIQADNSITFDGDHTRVGKAYTNEYYRGYIKYPLTEYYGQEIKKAYLNVYAHAWNNEVTVSLLGYYHEDWDFDETEGAGAAYETWQSTFPSNGTLLFNWTSIGAYKKLGQEMPILRRFDITEAMQNQLNLNKNLTIMFTTEHDNNTNLSIDYNEMITVINKEYMLDWSFPQWEDMTNIDIYTGESKWICEDNYEQDYTNWISKEWLNSMLKPTFQYQTVDNCSGNILIDILPNGSVICETKNEGGTIYNQVNFTEDYYEITNRFYNLNWTELYEQRISEQFDLTNLSNSGYDPSPTDDWNLGNLTTEYPNLDTDSTNDYTSINYFTEYSNTGYKKENLTSDYPNLDIDSTDDYSDSDIDGSETAFNNWDKNLEDDMTYENITTKWINLDIDSTDDYSDSDIDGTETAFDNFDKNMIDDWNLENETYNTTEDIQNAINTSGFYNIQIDCDNILFDNGLGSVGICDGTDDGSGGSGTTYNNENFTGNYYGVSTRFDNENFTEQFSIHNLTCIQLTGSADLCDGSDDGTEGSIYNQANFTEDYYEITNRFYNINWTELYEQRINEQFDLTNLSNSGYDPSSLDDWNLGNLTIEYPNLDTDSTNDYTSTNYFTEYTSTGYKKENLTSDYPNLDIDSTDDYSDSDIDGSETAFNNWDKNLEDDMTYENITTKWINLDIDSTDDYTSINYFTEYSNTGYKKENLTTDYPNLDIDSTDDITIELDPLATKNNTDVSFNNVSIKNTNTSIGDNFFYVKNSTCGCFRFLTGGEICSCTN